MINYAKIKDDGGILHMPSPTHISNPSAASLASWAEAQGYKEIVFTPAPSSYHSRSYISQDEHIACIWAAPTLLQLQAEKKKEAEREKEQALQASTTLEVDGVGAVLYDTEAQINIIGLLVMGAGLSAPIDFTLADDSVVRLNSAQLKSIALSYEAHKTAIHERKRQAFTLIESAEALEDLLN